MQESLDRNFAEAVGLLEAAIWDCTAELWEASMWDVPVPDTDDDFHGPDGHVRTVPVPRHAMVQRRSTP